MQKKISENNLVDYNQHYNKNYNMETNPPKNFGDFKFKIYLPKSRNDRSRNSKKKKLFFVSLNFTENGHNSQIKNLSKLIHEFQEFFPLF